MRLLVVATVTADGRPLAGPVDGYFVHGSFYFSSGRDSVRMRHLAVRPAVSATYVTGEDFAVTVHGQAELFDVLDPGHGDLRQAMLDHYLPRQGPDFETWLNQANPVGARIAAEKMFTYAAVALRSGAGQAGGQADAGQPLGLGPQPGRGDGVAGPARRLDGGGGTDSPNHREGRKPKLFNGVRFGLSRPRLAPAFCRFVRVNPGCAALLIRFQPRWLASSARCKVIIRSASLDWA